MPHQKIVLDVTPNPGPRDSYYALVNLGVSLERDAKGGTLVSVTSSADVPRSTPVLRHDTVNRPFPHAYDKPLPSDTVISIVESGKEIGQAPASAFGDKELLASYASYLATSDGKQTYDQFAAANLPEFIEKDKTALKNAQAEVKKYEAFLKENEAALKHITPYTHAGSTANNHHLPTKPRKKELQGH